MLSSPKRTAKMKSLLNLPMASPSVNREPGGSVPYLPTGEAIQERRVDVAHEVGTKGLLGIKDLTADEIRLTLDTAESFIEVSTREIKKVPTLRGRTVINLFFEASTRTRTSFEIAGKRLSADTINISASASSVVKGETLIDTARNLEAMNPDVIVIRHSAAGARHMLAKLIKQSIINAGDGAHEHPRRPCLI